MIKREKSLVIPASYTVTFETCVKTIEQFKLKNGLGIKQYFRIKSANVQSGKMTARCANSWRMDAQISGDAVQSTVIVTLIYKNSLVDMIGFVARYVDEFFEALLQNITPLVGNNQALQRVISPAGTLPSSNYTPQAARYRLDETGVGTATKWIQLVVVIFVCLSVLGACIAAAHGGH